MTTQTHDEDHHYGMKDFGRDALIVAICGGAGLIAAAVYALALALN
jgi:hypothetical protein